jgi:hypothetical protein
VYACLFPYADSHGRVIRPFPFDVCFYFDVYLGEKQHSKQTIIYLRNELRQSKKYYKLKVVILGKKVCNHFISQYVWKTVIVIPFKWKTFYWVALITYLHYFLSILAITIKY